MISYTIICWKDSSVQKVKQKKEWKEWGDIVTRKDKDAKENNQQINLLATFRCNIFYITYLSRWNKNKANETKRKGKIKWNNEIKLQKSSVLLNRFESSNYKLTTNDIYNLYTTKTIYIYTYIQQWHLISKNIKRKET